MGSGMFTYRAGCRRLRAQHFPELLHARLFLAFFMMAPFRTFWKEGLGSGGWFGGLGAPKNLRRYPAGLSRLSVDLSGEPVRRMGGRGCFTFQSHEMNEGEALNRP